MVAACGDLVALRSLYFCDFLGSQRRFRWVSWWNIPLQYFWSSTVTTMQNIYELYEHIWLFTVYYTLWYIYIIYCANVHTDLWKKWRVLITLDNDFWVNKLEGGCNPRKNIHEFWLVSARGTSHSSSLILAAAISRADTWWIWDSVSAGTWVWRTNCDWDWLLQTPHLVSISLLNMTPIVGEWNVHRFWKSSSVFSA